MKKGWRFILILVAVCIAFGIVCAGVGSVTGADTGRINAVFQQRAEERYNIDLEAVVMVWIPEVVEILRSDVAALLQR